MYLLTKFLFTNLGRYQQPMGLFLNILLAVCGLVVTLAAFGGETWRRGDESIKHRITSRGWIALVALLVAFTVAVIKEIRNYSQTQKAEIESKSAKTTIETMAQTITNLTAELKTLRSKQDNLPQEVSQGVNQGVNRLLSQATNSALGDAALSATIQDIAVTIQDKKKTEEKFEAINTDILDVSAWKARYENKLEIAQLNHEKALKEAEQARRETEKANREAEQASQKAAREAAEKVAQEAKQQENFIGEKTRPVFDYAIRNLLIFADHARQSGETPVTTYKGFPPLLIPPYRK